MVLGVEVVEVVEAIGIIGVGAEVEVRVGVGTGIRLDVAVHIAVHIVGDIGGGIGGGVGSRPGPGFGPAPALSPGRLLRTRLLYVPQDAPHAELIRVRGVLVILPAQRQPGVQLRYVDAGADEDELREALLAGLPRLGVEAQEPPHGVHRVPVARVGGTEVDVPLDAVEPLGPAVEEGHEAAGVHGRFGGEGEALVGAVQMGVTAAAVRGGVAGVAVRGGVAGGTVRGGVAGVAAVTLLARLRAALGLPVAAVRVRVLAVVVQVVEGELPDALPHRLAVQEELHVHAPVRGGDDGGPVGMAAHLVEDAVALPRRYPVGLVDHDEVGDLQMPVDLGVPLSGGVELGGVHDLHETAVHDVRVLAGEHHAHEFLRLREPARLDDDDVDAGRGPGEPFQIHIEFTGVHGAAQTPVAEGHGGVAELARDGHGVDLDGAEIVDDRADATASAAVQQMVQQGRLARSQESREDDDWNLLLTHVWPLASTHIKVDQFAQDAYTSQATSTYGI